MRIHKLSLVKTRVVNNGHGLSFRKKRILFLVFYIKKVLISIPMTYKGVVVSLNPLKIPCMAKVRRTAGAPNDLVTKYFSAGASIGEFCYVRNRICVMTITHKWCPNKINKGCLLHQAFELKKDQTLI